MTHNKPQIVTLCGSTRFKDEFLEASKQLTARGVIVLSVGWFGHCEVGGIPDDVKQKVDELHFRKIDISDWVLVLDVNGYIGQSTNNEIEYALKKGKPVLLLSWLEFNYSILLSEFTEQKC
ncbi:MAG: hypothetical protein V7L23_18645 [Nostoc sp.]|uniref:hypothetical protein n=1 Tax=Nostoc sp. TaxID=1180 RepID=UPI002FF18E71